MWPGEQAFPQVPQCPWSESVSAQAPEQSMYPSGQVKVQEPDEQTSPAAQAALHSPQCEGSFERFLHTPAQSLYPSGHEGVQDPSMQT